MTELALYAALILLLLSQLQYNSISVLVKLVLGLFAYFYDGAWAHAIVPSFIVSIKLIMLVFPLLSFLCVYL